MKKYQTRSIFEFSYWIVVPNGSTFRDCSVTQIGESQALRVTMQDPAKYRISNLVTPPLWTTLWTTLRRWVEEHQERRLCKKRIAKIWADYEAAVGQLHGEPEEMA
ncbi:hypothetical protein N7490_007737 [Penicillium lividum]|nr:hypothetical protein N7490_007737 [Penicillium lividum]